jgi:hypothetical protein
MKFRRFLVLALCVGACASPQPRPAPVPVFDLPAEIARWEAESKRKGHPAEAHKNLAMLYSHPSLTAPDYRRSLEELESYVTLQPRGADEPDVKRWLGVLRALREAQRAADRQSQENAALKGENRELQKNLAEARREAKEAREAIEKLKELDLQQDRMRKTR